jgi:hypothetical protein
MFSAMQISETAHGVVLSYPLWTGIAFLGLAAILAVYGVAGGRWIKRRWPMTVAVLVAAWAGAYFATFKATLNEQTGSVYAFLRYDHAVRWKDAADIYLEQRGGANWHIVVLDRERRAFDFNVADLSIDDRDRIMAYMVDRMPESAFARDPTLLKRQAPHGPRPASFLGDQQI